MIHISKYWAREQKIQPYSENRIHYIDNLYMITKHPHWKIWDLISECEKDFLTNKLKTNSMSKLNLQSQKQQGYFFHYTRFRLLNYPMRMQS
jgi:hypothetical protein